MTDKSNKTSSPEITPPAGTPMPMPVSPVEVPVHATQTTVPIQFLTSGDTKWYDRALRQFCELHGPSGGAWNISMLLDHMHNARSMVLEPLLTIIPRTDLLRELASMPSDQRTPEQVSEALNVCANWIDEIEKVVV